MTIVQGSLYYFSASQRKQPRPQIKWEMIQGELTANKCSTALQPRFACDPRKLRGYFRRLARPRKNPGRSPTVGSR